MPHGRMCSVEGRWLTAGPNVRVNVAWVLSMSTALRARRRDVLAGLALIEPPEPESPSSEFRFVDTGRLFPDAFADIVML